MALESISDIGYKELLKIGLTTSPNTVHLASIFFLLVSAILLYASVRDKKIRLFVILTVLFSPHVFEWIYGVPSFISGVILFAGILVYHVVERIADKRRKRIHIAVMPTLYYRIFLFIYFIFALIFIFVSKFDLSAIFRIEAWVGSFVYSLPILLSLLAFTEPRKKETLPLPDKIFSFLLSILLLPISPLLSLVPMIQLLKEAYNVLLYSHKKSEGIYIQIFFVIVVVFWVGYSILNNLGSAVAWSIFLGILSYVLLFSSPKSFIEKLLGIAPFIVFLLSIVVFYLSVLPDLSFSMVSPDEITAFLSYPDSYILGHPYGFRYISGSEAVILPTKCLFEVNYTSCISSNIPKSNLRRYLIFSLDGLYKASHGPRVFMPISTERFLSGNIYLTRVVYISDNGKYAFSLILADKNTLYTKNIRVVGINGYVKYVPFTKIIPLSEQDGYLGYIINIDGIGDTLLYKLVVRNKPVFSSGRVYVYDISKV